MVVVCVVYCDCDLTALLYLLLEVCVCVLVFVRAHMQKQEHSCHDGGRNPATMYTTFSSLTHAHGFSLLSLNGRANTPMVQMLALAFSVFLFL